MVTPTPPPPRFDTASSLGFVGGPLASAILNAGTGRIAAVVLGCAVVCVALVPCNMYLQARDPHWKRCCTPPPSPSP